MAVSFSREDLLATQLGFPPRRGTYHESDMPPARCHNPMIRERLPCEYDTAGTPNAPGCNHKKEASMNTKRLLGLLGILLTSATGCGVIHDIQDALVSDYHHVTFGVDGVSPNVYL